MKWHWFLFLVILFTATSLKADFDVIASESFESTQVQEVFVDTIISAGGSITSNGITVTSTSDIETSVSIASAINEHFEKVTIVNLAGGKVTMDVATLNDLSSSSQAGSSALASCSNHPDPDYSIGICRNHWVRTIVDITICAIPMGDLPCPEKFDLDSTTKARIPGSGAILEEDFPDTIFRRYSFHKNAEVSKLYSGNCSLTSTCSSDPVLFIHGYQPAPTLKRLNTNGGPKYWGVFSDRLIGDGYRPYEFIWLTNARFEDVANDLKAAIEQIESETGRSVHIVAHSFGGVLTRTLLQTSIPPLNQIAHSIASLTTIGTPHNGIFDGKTDFKGITFPKGQAATTHDFELCNQVSCHLMGENVMGSIMASLLKVGLEPGDGAYFLAAEESRKNLLDLNIQSLIGFGRNDGVLNDNATGGDGLISGEGQRFYPKLVFTAESVAKWDGTLFKYSEGMGDARITEYFLGRDEVSDGDPYLEPHEPSVPRDFVGFIHSPGTAIGPDWGEFDEIESFVPPGDGFHDVYQRTVDWIVSNSPPPPPPPSIFNNRLNDTGIVFGSGSNTSCIGDFISAQDCSHGRDSTHNDPSDGPAGFRFTKLDGNGFDVPNWSAIWECVRDEVTGLVWEVKTNDGGLRDKDNDYSWYNLDIYNNGGSYGRSDGGTCPGTWCDTDGYVRDVNNMANSLCGARDWKMPTREELRSILNYNVDGLLFNSDYFPYANSQSYYWTSSPYAYDSDDAWLHALGVSLDLEAPKSNDFGVILVRESE